MPDINSQPASDVPQRSGTAFPSVNTNKSMENADPISKKIFTTDKRSEWDRSDVPVKKFRLPRFKAAFNQYFEDAKQRADRDSMKLEVTPTMGHHKTYPEVLGTKKGEYGLDRHKQHYWEKQIGTVAGARRAIEAARNMEEQQASELLQAISKKYPQILLTRRRF